MPRISTTQSRVGLWLLAALWVARVASGGVIFDRASAWRWRPGITEASSPVQAWRSIGFNDREFTNAPAPFWYGAPYTGGTFITGMQNVYLCLFLQKTFIITNVDQIESLRLGAIVDDGFVAWINGTEVQRVNMSGAPGTPVSISTLAINAVEPVQFITYDLPNPANYLVPGTNVIAVQVFQSSLGSSDIGFDASLEAVVREPLPDLPPSIGAVTPPAGATVRSLTQLTVSFNKPVQGVDPADLLVNAVPASDLIQTSPAQFVFTFAQPATGTVQIAWAANHAITDFDTPAQTFSPPTWTYMLDLSAVDSPPYISEFMASNSRTLADENGDFSDWIEIYNPSVTSVNLEGWSLTDSTNSLTKWRFPATNLASGSFLVVFASEKDRRVAGAPLHTNFKLGADGEYLALLNPDGAVVTEFAPKYPPQVADISCGFVQSGDTPLYTRGSDLVYFTQATPGAANLGGTGAPGPAILTVQHSPNVPSADEDLLVTARVAPSFDTVASVTITYRFMYGSEGSVPMFDDGAHGDGAANDGVFGATIPVSSLANPSGKMIRYYVKATDLTGHSSRWPLYPEPTGNAQYLGTVISANYVTSALPVIHLFSPPSVLHSTPSTTGADSQTGSYGVSVFYDGEFYDNIYVAVRGNTTAGYPKKSHRFEFNREHPFRHPGVGYGQPIKPGPRIRKTSFEADYPDPTYMRQGLSFWLCDQIGSPASFYYPVRLQLNGEFFELASHNDVQGEELLDRLGYDPNGALYNAAGTLQPSEASTGGFEKKTRKWEGDADYKQLANAISESLPNGARRTNIFDMLDLPNVISYLVAARFVQENDDVWANMSVYHDNDGDNLWRIVSFDMNLSWGAAYLDNPTYDTGIQATNDNHKGFPLYGSSQALSLTSGTYNRIYDVIFDIPETVEMFRRRMRTVLDTYVFPPDAPLNSSPIEQKILAWRDLITADAALDRTKWGWPGIGGQNNLAPASLAQGVDDLLQKFFYLRRAHFYGKHSVTNTALSIGTAKTQNAGFPLPQPADAVITVTDLDFNPASGNQDEEYVCLRNSNPVALDVSGWSLAGAVTFTFAPGTVIPATSSIYVSPNVRAFRARTLSPHGREGRFVVGSYSGQLSARGETIQVRNSVGDLLQSFTYDGAPTLAQQFLRITELMYHPAPAPGGTNAENYEYIQLKNISTNTTLDLRGMHFTDGIAFDFTGSSVTQLAPGQTIYLARNLLAFRSRYGTDLAVAGEYDGALDNNGERIRLRDSVGEEILDFRYDNKWYPESDGHGAALRVANETAAPDLWNSKENWFAATPASLTTSAASLTVSLTDQTNIQLIVRAALNQTYTLEFSDDLSVTGWHKLQDMTVSSPETVVTLPLAGAHRFYRVAAEPAL